MARLRQPQRNLGLAAVLWMAVGVAPSGCEHRPEEYDYHGGTPDVRQADSWPMTDQRVLDSIRGEDQTPEVDIVDVLPDSDTAQAEIVTPDIPTDTVLPLDRLRDCTLTLTTPSPDGSTVFLAGDFTSWQHAQLPMSDSGNGIWSITVDLAQLSPGGHAYKFHTANDTWFLDASNPLTLFADGFENSKLLVPDCRTPEIVVRQQAVTETSLHVVAEVRNGMGSEGIRPATAQVLFNGKPRGLVDFQMEDAVFDIHITDLPPRSKGTLLISIENEFGSSEPLYVALWLDDGQWTWQDGVIYFAFIDRFSNGDTTNDSGEGCLDATSTRNWLGGDFRGITQKIQEGYFAELGINILWLSPVQANPDGCFVGTIPEIQYTAYHGYYPSDSHSTRDSFGSMQELQQLVQEAHQRGIRVLVDFVANHVSDQHPLWQQHATDHWFNPFYSCRPNWDKPVECWFEPYLPDFNFYNDAVVEWVTDNALFWIRETGIDGFRVDAVKHMPHHFLKALRWKIHQHIERTSNLPFYLLGETFVGEWNQGEPYSQEIIKEYIHPMELNGQFDFPFYWKLLRAVARNEGNLQELAQFVGEAAVFWGNAWMSNFIGNHDVPRFSSHAAGHIDDMWGNGASWQGISNPPEQPSFELPYLKTGLALELILTLPAIPTIYYGDEIGLAGAGDPDNRRMMTFEGWNPHQQDLSVRVRRAGSARTRLAPLRRGTLVTVDAQPDLWVFARTYQQETVVVVANRLATSTQKAIDGLLPGDHAVKDGFTGESLGTTGAQGQLSVTVPGYSVRVVFVDQER